MSISSLSSSSKVQYAIDNSSTHVYKHFELIFVALAIHILTISLPQIHPISQSYEVCILYKFCQLCWQLLPIMLALCSMLLLSYYAQNYAEIIASSLAYLYSLHPFLYLHRTCLYLHTFGHLEIYKF